MNRLRRAVDTHQFVLLSKPCDNYILTVHSLSPGHAELSKRDLNSGN